MMWNLSEWETLVEDEYWRSKEIWGQNLCFLTSEEQQEDHGLGIGRVWWIVIRYLFWERIRERLLSILPLFNCIIHLPWDLASSAENKHNSAFLIKFDCM